LIAWEELRRCTSKDKGKNDTVSLSCRFLLLYHLSSRKNWVKALFNEKGNPKLVTGSGVVMERVAEGKVGQKRARRQQQD